MPYRHRNISGFLIRTRREELGMTQEELAVKLQVAGLSNLDRGGVSKIEAGTRSVFDYELAVISEVLNSTPGAFLPDFDEVKASLANLVGKRIRN